MEEGGRATVYTSWYPIFFCSDIDSILFWQLLIVERWDCTICGKLC